MKDINKLPIYYQNTDVSVEKEVKKKEKRNFVAISFYQSEYHQPGILYKPISKIWKPENE